MSDKRLVVGLGNPGKDYTFTRHNFGFLVVQKLAQKLELEFSLSSFTNGLTAEGLVCGVELIILMPLTYMNNSGNAVRQVLNKAEMPIEQILVVTDDLNLDFGQLRLKVKGSDGGHNGLKSIIEKINSDGFHRLKLGIGYPKHADEVVNYVLDGFNKKEQKQIDQIIDHAAQCCQVWLLDGAEKAMEQFNRRIE